MTDSGEMVRPQFVYSLEYTFVDADGHKQESGSAGVIINQDGLEFSSRGHVSFRIVWREIASFAPGNVRLQIRLINNRTLEVSKLGRMYERFVGEVLLGFHSAPKKSLLMNEEVIDTFDGIHFSVSEDAHGLQQQIGTVYLQKTGVTVVSDAGVMQRFPFAFIIKILDDSLNFEFHTSFGRCLQLGPMAERTDRFRGTLEAAAGNLEKNAYEYILSLGGIDAAETTQLSRLFLDGRAVSRHELAQWPQLWEAMLANLTQAGLHETAAFFMGDAGAAMRICLKRGAVGAQEDYLACFFPITAKDGSRRVVMEAALQGSDENATYVFAVPKEDDIELFLDMLNYCLYMINFRREPIYMNEEALAAAGQEDYQDILALPELRWLKNCFTGRITHDVHWASRVMAELF